MTEEHFQVFRKLLTNCVPSNNPYQPVNGDEKTIYPSFTEMQSALLETGKGVNCYKMGDKYRAQIIAFDETKQIHEGLVIGQGNDIAHALFNGIVEFIQTGVIK